MKQSTFFIAILLGLFFFVGKHDMHAASTLYFPHTNHQGSIIAVTDENGEVVKENFISLYGYK